MIQFGNYKIKEIYVGSDKIKEVYHGADLVWSGKKPSYAILTDDTRVDFELENTPMSNFNSKFSTVTINSSPTRKTDIKELVFGDSYKNVTSTGDYFLGEYSSLTSVDLSVFVNVTSIGGNIFANCTSLTSINLPDSLTSIGNSTFNNCYSLTSITLPEGLTSIGISAFGECSSLTSITLPDSLTSIKADAFNNCASLSLVTSLSTIPPSLSSNVFYRTHSNLNIKVPAQSVNAYKTATNWNSYASKISAI